MPLAITSLPRLTSRNTNLVCAILFGGWCVGQVFLDRTWLTGLLFYIPSPVVLGCLAGAAIWNGRTGFPRLSGVAILASMPVLFMILMAENHFRAPTTSSDAKPRSSAPASQVTLVHWNVASARLGWQRVRDKLTAQRAEIYVLSEPPAPGRIRQWQTTDLGADYDAKWFGKMFVVAAGTIHDERWLVRTRNSHVCSFRWSHKEMSMHVFGVDLISNLDVHRDPLLKQLNDLIQEHQPDIVVGDFNAPRRSYRLQHLPTGYRHAYDLAGTELGYTWPIPIPVYSLDQCIVGHDLQVLRYDLQTSFSDHRLQRLEFRRKR